MRLVKVKSSSVATDIPSVLCCVCGKWTPTDVLRRTLPMLIRLGDFIGNGEKDPARADSLGERCDLIGDIRALVDGEPVSAQHVDLDANALANALTSLCNALRGNLRNLPGRVVDAHMKARAVLAAIDQGEPEDRR